ncbi:MAG: DUF2520 domain-containing protein [Proteobacteria bacterium]|nr:DUF2520 domain-containing protein [Pseudomonadota bacterium]
MKPSFSIVGCGKVGTTLARYLTGAGYTVHGLASRCLESAKKAAELSGATTYSTDPLDVTPGADMVFITTPDGLIKEVCDAIAAKGGFSDKNMVFHCSGSLPSTLLGSAKKQGAVIGSVHPLQSFASAYGDKNPFEGIVMALEGDEAAVNVGLEMAETLGAKGFRIQTDAKTLYHASAVVASNYLVTLVDFAYQLLASSGIDHKDAYTVLGPLIEGTLANIKKVGTVQALTGPVVRGDSATVSDHLDAIKDIMPHVMGLYTVLGRHTLEIAKKRGTLTESSRDELTRLFSEP